MNISISLGFVSFGRMVEHHIIQAAATVFSLFLARYLTDHSTEPFASLLYLGTSTFVGVAGIIVILVYLYQYTKKALFSKETEGIRSSVLSMTLLISFLPALLYGSILNNVYTYYDEFPYSKELYCSEDYSLKEQLAIYFSIQDEWRRALGDDYRNTDKYPEVIKKVVAGNRHGLDIHMPVEMKAHTLALAILAYRHTKEKAIGIKDSRQKF